MSHNSAKSKPKEIELETEPSRASCYSFDGWSPNHGIYSWVLVVYTGGSSNIDHSAA